jgi:hypothetical protein
MKKNNTLSLFVIMLSGILLSCTKKADYPVINPVNSSRPSASIVISEWFYPNWEHSVYNKDVPKISVDILRSGKVLVFGKGGYETGTVTALPAKFDANYIGIDKRIGALKFVMVGTGAIPPSLQFRYILIPPDALTPYPEFDYNNYFAVCTYFKIPG